MPLVGIKIERFAALMNGVFIGVGIIFLIWGATDIAFPITERMNVAVFGLTRIILGIISLSVGVGVEAVQWAKIGKEFNPQTPSRPVLQSQAETTQESETTSTAQPAQTAQAAQIDNPSS